MEDTGIVSGCSGFEWDQGNIQKNWLKHKVSPVECEEAFSNEPLIVVDDPEHSAVEKRHTAFGRTNMGRLLVMIFTKRGALLRVISARGMNRRERKFYEENQ